MERPSCVPLSGLFGPRSASELYSGWWRRRTVAWSNVTASQTERGSAPRQYFTRGQPAAVLYQHGTDDGHG